LVVIAFDMWLTQQTVVSRHEGCECGWVSMVRFACACYAQVHQTL
jgi:hypothetical protein